LRCEDRSGADRGTYARAPHGPEEQTQRKLTAEASCIETTKAVLNSITDRTCGCGDLSLQVRKHEDEAQSDQQDRTKSA
jgi:hypothetical protein